MECHHSSDINNLDSLKLMMQHGNYPNVGSKDEKGGGGGGGAVGTRRQIKHGTLRQASSVLRLQNRLVAGFICPPFWYYATVLYFGNYYHPKDASVQMLMQAVLVPQLR